MAEDGLFKLKIISPQRIFYEGEAKMVELNTSEGEIGIYKNHIPLTMILAPGVLTVTEESGTKKAALHSGFIEILQDRVTILAETAEWPDEIDITRAKEAKERAEERLRRHETDANIAKAEMALHRSLARLSVTDKKM